jgi:hypothetical protein
MFKFSVLITFLFILTVLSSLEKMRVIASAVIFSLPGTKIIALGKLSSPFHQVK